MRPPLIAALGLAAGCTAQLGHGTHHEKPDAAATAEVDSGAGSASPDAAPAPLCVNGRQIYLNFDGVAVTQAGTSDATQNKISWMQNASANVPQFRANDANRTTEIQTIVDGIKARLQGMPFTITTTRPTAGPYVMIIFGGTNTLIGTQYTTATNAHDCGDVVKSDVGWIADGVTIAYAQDLAVGAIGWGLGLNGTNDASDCMCAWGNGCVDAGAACSLHANINSNSNPSCPNQNPQNEVAAFSTQFCQ